MDRTVATNTEAGTKHRFERCNPTYIYAIANISERALGYYRKSLKEVSKTLAEAVSALWKERAEAPKRAEQETPLEDEQHSQARERALPADQPTIE